MELSGGHAATRQGEHDTTEIRGCGRLAAWGLEERANREELDENIAAAHRETSRLFLMLQKEVGDALKARAARDERNIQISHALAARHPLNSCSSCNPDRAVESTAPASAGESADANTKAQSQQRVSSPSSAESSGTSCALSESSRGSSPTNTATEAQANQPCYARPSLIPAHAAKDSHVFGPAIGL